MYEELYYGGQKPLSMKYFDQQNLVLHCSSFSKTLGAGFRVGWVYAGKFSDHIQHLQLMSTISVNALIQNALVEFLSHHHYEKHLRTLRLSLERYKKQFYHYLKQHLPAICEIYYYPSGYFLWVKLPHKLDSMQIYEELIQQDIGVAPSPLFSVLPAQQHYLRINCSFEWNEKIQTALDQVIKTIQQRVEASL
ncbi:aminotransferase class I and II family protein [Acinetobacter baumannii 984213]|nr:aminotransferase class I and II family protein [Acinetobacter baumannii 984213]